MNSSIDLHTYWLTLRNISSWIFNLESSFLCHSQVVLQWVQDTYETEVQFFKNPNTKRTNTWTSWLVLQLSSADWWLFLCQRWPKEWKDDITIGSYYTHGKRVCSLVFHSKWLNSSDVDGFFHPYSKYCVSLSKSTKSLWPNSDVTLLKDHL